MDTDLAEIEYPELQSLARKLGWTVRPHPDMSPRWWVLTDTDGRQLLPCEPTYGVRMYLLGAISRT
jgi:hypothetical protein